ncbi:hypothetical protein BDZ90DRAFT_279713 [Jaminaea rosea]|uniref:Phosphoglycerate mutase-like protein n=1 Tax=Jaminaea rosea TaxID=1569628 RepID=A0A316UPY8_9BASI|nr:hypothetical protein BDZ90DRAFT_279713 [Jaminaea rosea]PWN27350.1 hypothetical protein BDZ90DRAFT_279713 [Jaminaea rosea]
MSSCDTRHPHAHFGFEVVSGYFVFDEPTRNPASFPAIPENFGLLPNRTWSSLVADVQQWNEEAQAAGKGTEYKLVFAARHGEGFHNVAEAKYGTEAWDAKWALLNGDGEAIWGPDPELTPIGEDQARSVNREWQRQLHLSSQSKDHAPLPTKLFSSPLKRSSRTLQLSYEGLLLPPGTIPPGGEGKAVGAPYVKEDLREQYGNDNTCINRSTKSEIQRNFPHFEIEQGFTEEDERFKVSLAEGREVAKVLGRSSIEAPYITDGLRENYRDVHTCDERSTRSVVKGYNPGWTIEPGFTEEDGAFGKIHETVDEMTTRVAKALKDIFQLSKGHQVIHISSHSGVMESLWRATNHKHFKPATGAIVPLVVKFDPTSSSLN